jgi:intein-encoded DNA endonuclease-like protein
MAYILGFLYADGNITKTKRGNCYVAVYSADYQLVCQMREVLGSRHKIAVRLSDTGRVYRIQVGSKEWYKDLGTRGLHPNKARRIKLPRLPDAYFGSFVRGYFDGDGNVWSGQIHKKRKTHHDTIQVAFTSASAVFLEKLREELTHRGVVGGSIYIPKIRHYGRLAFSRDDALKIYKIMYNAPHKLFLKRKKIVFEKFVKKMQGKQSVLPLYSSKMKLNFH